MHEGRGTRGGGGEGLFEWEGMGIGEMGLEGHRVREGGGRREERKNRGDEKEHYQGKTILLIT